MKYAEYLTSEEWREKAAEAIEAAGHRCQVCNASDEGWTLHVHHRVYGVWGQEEPGDLTVLCERCHAMYHHKPYLPSAIAVVHVRELAESVIWTTTTPGKEREMVEKLPLRLALAIVMANHFATGIHPPMPWTRYRELLLHILRRLKP